MSNNIIASVTRSGTYEPFDLQVARGQVMGHTQINLFGYNTAISNATAASGIPIWENATAYTYITSASTLTLVSTSASDNTSARVLINGLDANFVPISETLALNGVTGVTTVNSYFRVNSIVMVAPGTSQNTNVGTITLKQSANTIVQINPGIGKNQTSIYTVPAGHSFYLDLVEINTDNGYLGNALVYNVQTINRVNGVKLSVLQQPFVIGYNVNRTTNPFVYTEKVDIQWQIAAPLAGTDINAGIIITGKLIQNNTNLTDSGN